MKTPFDVGDRVVAVKPVGRAEVTEVPGTVVHVDSDFGLLGVEFDYDIGGHDLLGLCKYGHGWNCRVGQLDHYINLRELNIPDEISLF